MRASLLPALALATIAGATPAGDQDKALPTAALLEMNNMATAMEMFYIDHGLFTTLENLDDGPFIPAGRPWQYINDGGGALVFNPLNGVLFRQFFPPETYPGPYISSYADHRIEGPDGDYDLGTPLDPWGTPYYFYSPLGLIEPRTDSISLRYHGDAFDRYTIVSHGPSGQPGGDDLIHQFGLTITVATISSARVEAPPGKDAAYRIRIRGYNLGAGQGEGEVLFDGEPSGLSVLEWAPQEVLAEAPTPPEEGTGISLRLDSGAETRTVPLLGLEETRVGNWLNFD